MTRLSTMLACAVLLLGLPACGDKSEHAEEQSEWLSKTVPVRHLTANLFRGASADLYPDGRALVGVMSLGGGTEWRGTWTEEGDVLTITLPRMQEQKSDWSAPEDVDPPDEVVLRKTGDGTWIEIRSTITPFIKVPTPWKLSAINRIPKVALDKDYRFLSEEDWEEAWGWEVVEDLPDSSRDKK